MPPYEYKKKDPLYGAAILAVTVEMQGGGLARYDGIVDDACEKLGVDRKELDRYIRKHRAELEATIRREGLA
jgi:hypothetical protein